VSPSADAPPDPAVRRDPLRVLVVEPERCLPVETVPRTPPARGMVWIDCRYDARREWVAPVEALTGVRIFENHLLDAENPSHPSYFESTQHYEMIVFRGLAPQREAQRSDAPILIRTEPTVLFLMPRVLVTLSVDDRLVSTLQARLLDAGTNHRLPARPDELMLRLLNGMVDRYLALRQPLTDQLERWQRELLDPRRPFRDWVALLDTRRELRKLENLSEEQLDALQEWRDERLDRRDDDADAAPHGEPTDDEGSMRAPMTDSVQVRVNDVVQHIERVLRHARRLQGSVESAVQLHFSATAHRTNEIIRVLTVLTAVFMPLTLITGIFGMNFEFIPGLHSPIGFWVTMAGMLLLAAALLALFRARRYISSSGARDFGSRRRRRQAAQQAAQQATGPDARPAVAPDAQPAAGAAPDSASTQSR
jgi:magnesium transporter